MNKIKRYILTILFLFLMTLPNCAIEIIQSKNEADSIKENTRKYDRESSIEKRQPEEVYIPNPIDYIFQKKNEKQIEEPKQASSMTLDCDEMDFKNETNELEAKGHVIITTMPDKNKLTADRAVFDRNNNIIKLFDNVKLYKDAGIIEGDYMVVNLNQENVLMNEPFGTFNTFKITAREGYAYANKLEAINGDIELAQKIDMQVASYGFGTFYDPLMIDNNIATHQIRKKRSEPYKIKTKEMIIQSGKDHDEITFKGADIYYKKYKLMTAPSISVYTDKEQSYAESNIPELGSMSDFGTYIGPGFVTKTPFNSTLKLVPAFVYDGQAGVGLIARHRSKRNMVEAAWATSSNNLIVRGKYKFNDDLYLDYDRHSYVDEWFMGSRRPGYLAQLVHHKTWRNEDLKADFTQRISAGYASEYQRDYEDQKDALGTMRLRYQAELNKQLFRLENQEQDMFIKGYVAGQAAATIYGTGQSTGVIRFAPGIESRVKGWGSRIYLAASGIHGRSPFLFDEYRYGKVSVSIDENIRLCKYLTLGYRGTFTPMKDNPEDRLLAENAFYIMAGPEDVKVAFSYDNVREITAFDVVFLLGSDNAKMQYDKLTIEDPTNVGKKRKPLEEWNLRKIKVPKDEAI